MRVSLRRSAADVIDRSVLSRKKKKMIGWFLGFFGGDYNGEREKSSKTLLERRGLKTRVFSPLLYFSGNFAVAQRVPKRNLISLGNSTQARDGKGREGRLKAM